MAKTNPKSNRSEIADLAFQIADHQARIQTIAANWGEEITEQLNASEKAFLSRLAKELKGFKFNPNAKETLERLKKISARLNAIRQAAYHRAEEKVKDEARKLAENETKWGKRITQELSEKGTKLKDATPALLDKVVKYGLADGKTLQEYFTGIADADAVRIESSIRQGVESGWTIDQIARNLAGTAENKYKDGIFETSRKSAVNMARTICNAVSNNAKDAFYNANSDVISGVEILSTLDGRTCPVCASLDRQRYPLGELHPSLPVHHQCRCVLLPVTPLSDLVEEQRPMAKSDFMKDAMDAYKKRFPNKDWNKLSESTKKKYYYEAMRLYEQRTGEPAYTQVAGCVSFRDYFEKYMSDDQRLKWLGPERFKLWQKGNLPLDKFIAPYPDKRLTVDALKELDKQSFDKKPTEMYIKDAIDNIDGKYSDLLNELNSFNMSKESETLEEEAKVARQALDNFDYYSGGGEKEYRRLRKWVKDTDAELNAFLEDTENDTMAKMAINQSMKIGKLSIYEPHKRLDPAGYKEYIEAKNGIERTYKRFCKMFSSKYHVNDLEVYASSSIDRAGYLHNNCHINLRLKQKPIYTNDPIKNKSKHVDLWRADVGTQVHEMAHDVEWANPHIRKRCQEFLAYRTKGESAITMNEAWLTNPNTPSYSKKQYPDGPYDPDEITKKDNFFSEYCGKIYNSGGTEIFSMGVQRLVESPEQFYKEDPEYFNFIVGVMRGDI